MNEREMLQYAAMAAGYKNTGWHEPSSSFWIDDDGPTTWNPLENDGDAFRLAVNLGMEAFIDDHPDGCNCVEAESYTHKSGRFLISLSAGNNKYAAVRKVIVMVAAEIGRNMK